MPTSDHDVEEVDSVYEQIREIMEREERGACIVIMGDMNAVIGEGREGKTVGSFGLVTRNERGEKLVSFCIENRLVVTNTWFKNHIRRLYTWKAPGDNARFQIDFIMIKERFRNSIKNVCTHPGADIDSDHNLLVAKMKVELKKIKSSHRNEKWNLHSLKNEC